MIEQRKCPLCEQDITDILQHLRIQHDIESTEQLSEEIVKLEQKKTKQLGFAKYVEELQQKKRNGEITAEEYRELIIEWIKENRV